MKIRTAREIATNLRAEKLVIVASRRTDMPAFHLEELVEGLHRGAFHPQGMRQAMWELRFEPSDIHSVGLWSQDFGPWLEVRPTIADYRFSYRFTILDDNPLCKPKAPPVHVQLEQLRQLVSIDGADAVGVFLDPLARYRKLGETTWHENFSDQGIEMILGAVAACGIGSVSTSVLDYYKKVERRAEERGYEFAFHDPTDPTDFAQMVAMVTRVTRVAERYGLTVETCCERSLDVAGITRRGACVNGKRLNNVIGPGACTRRDAGQRAALGCGCTRAVDVGRYIRHGDWSHACGHDCPQCYATP